VQSDGVLIAASIKSLTTTSEETSLPFFWSSAIYFPKSDCSLALALSKSPEEKVLTVPIALINKAHYVPFPAPGPPITKMIFGWLIIPALANAVIVAF